MMILNFFQKSLTRIDLSGIIKCVDDALLAQLDRVTGYEPVGQGFESLAAHQRGSPAASPSLVVKGGLLFAQPDNTSYCIQIGLENKPFARLFPF